MNMRESAHEENMLSAAQAAALSAKRSEELLRQLVARGGAITDEQVKHMIGRFLCWELPKSFNPDGGISYAKAGYNPPPARMPTGTNLFDYNQAEDMVRFMIEGLHRP